MVFVLFFLVGIAWYVDRLQTEMEGELANRQRLEDALADETKRVILLRSQLGQQEQQVSDLKEGFSQRRGDTALLMDAVSVRQQESEALRMQLAQREQELSALRKTTAQQDHLLSILRSQDSKVFLLTGTKIPSSGGLLMWEPQGRRALFYAFNLPALPTGQTYQLWAIGGRPLSVTLFKTDSSHKALLLIRGTAGWTPTTRFAVSIEPEGGQPKPTSDFYLTAVI
jgi:hypothetical protein